MWFVVFCCLVFFCIIGFSVVLFGGGGDVGVGGRREKEVMRMGWDEDEDCVVLCFGFVLCCIYKIQLCTWFRLKTETFVVQLHCKQFTSFPCNDDCHTEKNDVRTHIHVCYVFFSWRCIMRILIYRSIIKWILFCGTKQQQSMFFIRVRSRRIRIVI